MARGEVGGGVEVEAGCVHYKRNCLLVTPCCDKVYPCRVCHDEEEEHTLDRKTVKKVVCGQCKTRSDISKDCECGTVFGEAYFCSVCRLYDNEDKKQFHCDGCSICRVGGQDNFEHCFTCEMCMPKTSTHKCIEKSSRNNCPVCFEPIHTSRTATHIPPCGHLIHVPCYGDMLKSGLYSCPTCGRAMQDMSDAWTHVDREVAETPMPAEYANLYREVLCKDCSKASKTLFHIVGMKCGDCGSYNTSVEGPFQRKSGEEFVSLTDAELQRLYTVPLPGMSLSARIQQRLVSLLFHLTLVVDLVLDAINIVWVGLTGLSGFRNNGQLIENPHEPEEEGDGYGDGGEERDGDREGSPHSSDWEDILDDDGEEEDDQDAISLD